MPRVQVVALTRSDELLEQLAPTLGDHCDVRHVEAEEDVRQADEPRRAAVVLLDARGHTNPGAMVERLHASDGSTVVVVFAAADTVADIAQAIKGSAAFAVLPVPLEPDKTRAVLHGASEEALARHALVTGATTVAGVPAEPAATPETGAPRVAPRAPPEPSSAAPARPAADPSRATEKTAELAVLQELRLAGAAAGSSRGGMSRGVAVALVAAGLVIAAVAWFHLREEPTPAASPTPTGPSAGQRPAGASPSSKEELLDKARAAFHERRYTDPEGDNALFYYRSVIAQDPRDGEARQGLDRLATVLHARLRSALAEQRPEDAARALAQLRLIRPADPALGEIEQQLLATRIEAALAGGDAELAGALLQQADRSGALPASRAAQLRQRHARLKSAQRAEEMARDRQAIAPGRADEADGSLAEARADGITSPQEPAPPASAAAVAAPRADGPAAVATTREPEGSVAAAAQPELADPLGLAAQAPDPPPTRAAPTAADFKRTRYVAPIYPPQALARGQGGEVRLRITVASDGRVANAEVVAASPAGVFEQAALAAVRRWRFEPVRQDGRPIEASVATTIRFRPEDAATR